MPGGSSEAIQFRTMKNHPDNTKIFTDFPTEESHASPQFNRGLKMKLSPCKDVDLSRASHNIAVEEMYDNFISKVTHYALDTGPLASNDASTDANVTINELRRLKKGYNQSEKDFIKLKHGLKLEEMKVEFNA